jgi:hypothetical protein
MSWDTLLCIAVILIIITLAIDTWVSTPSFSSLKSMTEGFLTGPGNNPFLLTYFPRRGDISFEDDDAAYDKDKRHVMGYVDVQGLGVNHDFCRMIIPKGMSESAMFFSCALAGTEHLSSTSFKTLTVGQGFKTSRDDYMRDADGDKRTDYCAVVKMPGGSFEPQCYRALNTTFDTRQFMDTNPPRDIAEILYFYDGIMFWFRFIDDMKDYAENLKIYTSGSMSIDEVNVKILPSQLITDTTGLDDRIQITEGVNFNGINQFIRLGDSADMSFGNKIALPVMKAICFWAKFDEFTNNAHILDFGNGAGIDNVFIGIVGRGDPSMDTNEIRSSMCQNTLPDTPSGPQPVLDMSPQELMLSTANVDEYIYDKEVLPRNLPPMRPVGQEKLESKANTATLIYEIWNGKLRMEHLKVSKAFKLKKWTHICLTTSSSDGIRPNLQVWINGVKMAEKEGTHLPQVAITSNNYLGKSNWINSGSQYENKPELFNGNLFDVRGYSQPVTEDKLKKTIKWGKQRLGI